VCTLTLRGSLATGGAWRRGRLFGCVGGEIRALAGEPSACWDVGSFRSPFWLALWMWLVLHLFMPWGCGVDMTGWKFLGDFFFRFAPYCEPGEKLARFCPAKGGVDIVDTRVHVMP
jgi:hypothetical protein